MAVYASVAVGQERRDAVRNAAASCVRVELRVPLIFDVLPQHRTLANRMLNTRPRFVEPPIQALDSNREVDPTNRAGNRVGCNVDRVSIRSVAWTVTRTVCMWTERESGMGGKM